MTPRASALLDAALTVQRWRTGPYSGATLISIRRYLAIELGCCPAWAEIEHAIARRLLAEDAAERLAA